MNREISRLIYEPENLPEEVVDVFIDARDFINESGFIQDSGTSPHFQGFDHGFTLYGALAQAVFFYPDLPLSVQQGFQPVPPIWLEVMGVLRDYLDDVDNADKWHYKLDNEKAYGVLEELRERTEE